jgi:hypothetical protein
MVFILFSYTRLPGQVFQGRTLPLLSSLICCLGTSITNDMPAAQKVLGVSFGYHHQKDI